MLTVGSDLSSYKLAAGEPFVLEVQLQDASGVVKDINDDGLILSFYMTSNRAIVRDYNGDPAQYEGERFTDSAGEFFRWVFDGRFSEGMLGKSGVRVELAQRLRMGRKIITTGGLTIDTSAATVPSLDSERVSDIALRANIRDGAELGKPPTITITYLPYTGSAPQTPSVFSNGTWDDTANWSDTDIWKDAA